MLADVFDWLATAVSPKWGAKRAAYRRVQQKLSAEWPMADKNDRTRGQNWFDRVRNVDSALHDHLETAQARALDLYRSNTHAHAAVENRITNEIGRGLTYRACVRPTPGRITERQARTINEGLELQYRLLDRFGVDKTGRLSWGAFQRLLNRAFCNMGESFIEVGTRPFARNRAPIPLALDIQSPFRYGTPPSELSNPLIRMGIEYDINGEVIAYHRRRSLSGNRTTHLTGRFGTDEYERIPRFDERTGRPRILHVFEPMFEGQSRGLPWLIATASRIKDFDDWFEAEIIAKQIEACFSAFIKKAPGGLSPLEEAERNSGTTDAKGKRLEDLEPGIIQYLESDEDIVFGDPQRPGGQFGPFSEFMQRTFAAGGNIPFETYAKNFQRSSYSAGRLSALDGRAGYLTRVDTPIKQCMEPIGRELVFWAQLSELVPGMRREVYLEQPWLYEEHEWQPPGYRQVDPAKEQSAIDDGLESDSLTLIEVLANRGDNLTDFMDRRRQAKEALMVQDIELRKMKIDLEEAAGLPSEDEPAEEEDTSETEQGALCRQ